MQRCALLGRSLRHMPPMTGGRRFVGWACLRFIERRGGRGESPHPRSSFILIVLWMSSILWFTRCSYALRESMEFKESVSGSGRLRVDALGAGVRLLVAPPEGTCLKVVRILGGSSASWVTKGGPSSDGIAPAWVGGAAWGCVSKR
ncbi:hypothetical protein GW17_00045676 [Ensete ventricosum]|nr:hypothetical protein GW17_00045676 [Ensete ventricosum]